MCPQKIGQEGGLPARIWSHGVTVSTLDSESSDRGSNPRETLWADCFGYMKLCEGGGPMGESQGEKAHMRP